MRRVLTMSLAALVMTVLLATMSASAIASAGPSTSRAAGAERLQVKWYQAKHHMGQKCDVTGPVKGIAYDKSVAGSPTFINMGRNYPSKQRFTVVIWGKYREAFPFRPEFKYRGRALKVTGTIRRYEGIAEIFVRSPAAIEIIR